MNETIARELKDDVSIVLCGEAGQGIQTVERLLTRVMKQAGFNVFSTKEYMSRVRGGSNSTEIRISSKRRTAFVNRIDILIPLDKDAITHLACRISEKTLIIGEKEKLGDTGCPVIDVPFTKIAASVGGIIYANTVAVGMIMGLFRIELDILNEFLGRFFHAKSADVIQKNKEAGAKGYEIGVNLSRQGKIDISVQRHPGVKDEVLANGAEFLSMGAVAGGCNFIAAYPMTPSTGILTFMSQHSADFGIFAEQAEDEISAINMVIGAWYAGARGMVATAGGGYALMVEAVSLAGMIESPIVISVGQRPAPATGLPTRTEQGDLEHVLYSGHGEFPRLILAPGDIESAFLLTQKAFNLADKFQVPVYILNDQFLADMYYNMPEPDLSKLKVERYIVKTGKDYERFGFTESGISPRGIPGYGEGFVDVDSDEHDENGHITEDFDVRKKMVEKRLKKMGSIMKEIVPPELYGNENYQSLVVGWGTNYSVVKEALEYMGRDDVSFLHFSQVYPLHPDTAGYLTRAKNLILIENNATAQFGKLIKLYAGIDIQNKILKYNGLPFTVEEVVYYLNELLQPHAEPAVARAGV